MTLGTYVTVALKLSFQLKVKTTCIDSISRNGNLLWLRSTERDFEKFRRLNVKDAKNSKVKLFT